MQINAKITANAKEASGHDRAEVRWLGQTMVSMLTLALGRPPRSAFKERFATALKTSL